MPYAQIQVLLSYHIPKIIILEFEPEMITFFPKDYDRLSTLLPFTIDHPEIKALVKHRSYFEPIKLWSRLYLFNSTIFRIINENFLEKRPLINTNGYIPLKGYLRNGNVLNQVRKATYKPNNKIDSLKFNALESITKLCKIKNVALVVVNSPDYRYLINGPRHEDATSYLATFFSCRKDLLYFDYSSDTSFLKKELFRDPGHLNSTGAKVFSMSISHRLKQHLISNKLKTKM